ncbi:GNAT family N-acetyltransferase [Kineococcus rubinsiae]|uniref:GNAT family N-acetyltransferase n=1 Tax=Kineococcus rubinsiae TaxID=2609562 RepID=UPI001430151D|nr:GNAT family N-acetyltransferase [Kineococcus rubinsiae]NIZ92548.1 GNAT family N-acetyltransferase [Kineococcus rubinsiae]
MTSTDARATAELQLRYLSEGFFPRLGLAFVTRWHRAFVQQPHGWAAVVVDADERIVSYALVATRQRDFVEGVIRSQGLSMAASATLALAGRPRLLLHFLRTRTLRYVRRIITTATRRITGAQAAVATTDTSSQVVEAVVHAVVTVESARGLGCAATLLDAAERSAREDGATVIALVTDDLPPQEAAVRCTSGPRRGAAGLYEHLGWKRTAERVRDGRRILEYRRRLGPLPDQAGADGGSPPSHIGPVVGSPTSRAEDDGPRGETATGRR